MDDITAPTSSVFNEDDFLNILLRCDKDTLLAVSKTCRSLHTLLNTQRFWMQKFEYEFNFTPTVINEFMKRVQHFESGPDSVSPDYKRMVTRFPKENNLVGFMNGKSIGELIRLGVVFHDGGNGFCLEDIPVNAPADPRIQTCFATSYSWCERVVPVDLVEAGIEPWILDFIRPTIIIKELTICRSDSSSTYEMHTHLLREGESFFDPPKCRRKMDRRSWPQWHKNDSWEEVTLQFSEYPIGIRKLIIMSRGQDEQFWSGYYGAKFANLEVSLKWPKEPRIYSPEECPDQPDE